MTHFRHGARAPQNFYDKKNYLDYILNEWDDPGELTGMGQRMHFLLGLRNRIKYIIEEPFLSEKFDPHQILIYSSSLNRTIISVSSQLQGLYPQSIKKGETLSDEQIKISVPQVNIDYPLIKDEISNMSNYALPNSMILAPVRMINNNEKRMRLYDTSKCKEKTAEIKKKNGETLETLKNITAEFKEKYSEKANKLYGKELNYDLSFLDNFCDAFISGKTELKSMSKFKEAQFDMDEIHGFCQRFQVLNFRDWILGDEEHAVAHLEISKLMNETLHYLKERVDADKINEDIESKKEDYSRPKMVMYSGHDTTISCFEVFLMEALNKNISFYKYPQFATQISLEVVTDKEKKDAKTDSDYTINYYFDDENVVSMPMKEFIDKITPQIWTEDKINNYCGFTDNKNNESSKQNNLNLYKLCLIIFVSLSGVLLIITIILSVKLITSGKKESRIYNSLMPSNEE